MISEPDNAYIGLEIRARDRQSPNVGDREGRHDRFGQNRGTNAFCYQRNDDGDAGTFT